MAAAVDLRALTREKREAEESEGRGSREAKGRAEQRIQRRGKQSGASDKGVGKQSSHSCRRAEAE
jgi:hypothetical protein